MDFLKTNKKAIGIALVALLVLVFGIRASKGKSVLLNMLKSNNVSSTSDSIGRGKPVSNLNPPSMGIGDGGRTIPGFGRLNR